MDVVLQSRTPKYGIGRIHPKTAAGHGCIALLLLSTVKNGGVTIRSTGAVRSVYAGLRAKWFHTSDCTGGQHVHTIVALVDSGLGVALLPSVMQQRFANEGVMYRKLTNYPAAIEVGVALMYQPDRDTPAAERFRKLATNAFPVD